MTIVSKTIQNTRPMLKKNHEISGGAKLAPAMGTTTLPTTGMNQAGLACLMS